MTSKIAFGYGALRAGLVLLAGLTALAGAAPAAAQDHHPQVATLVKNLDQPSGPDIRTVLSKNQDGLMHGFRTGSNRGGYELESIWLYVRDTHESRYMTIRATVYRDAAMRHKVATLTRGQLSWQPPQDASPSGYQVQYRVRGAEVWEQNLSAGSETHVPVLFLEQDTEYE